MSAEAIPLPKLGNGKERYHTEQVAPGTCFVLMPAAHWRDHGHQVGQRITYKGDGTFIAGMAVNDVSRIGSQLKITSVRVLLQERPEE